VIKARLGAKGQTVAVDLAFAIFIFLLIAGGITWVWSNKATEAENSFYADEMQLLAEKALDRLIVNKGQPEDWETKGIDQTEFIGLAKRDRLLDEDKVAMLVKMSQGTSKSDFLTDVAGVWKFEDDLYDELRNYDGTFEGTANYEVGQEGKALEFDGLTNLVNVGNFEPTGNQLTVATWVYHRDGGDDRVICKAAGTAVADHVFCIGIANTTVRIRLDTGSTTSHDGTTAVPINDWTHVAFTYDGTEIRIYVNGQPAGGPFGKSGNIEASSQPVVIGNINLIDNRYFYGYIDEVIILERALTPTEIQDLFNNGISFGDYETTGQKLLIGANDYYFRLIDPNSITAYDTVTMDFGPAEVGAEPESNSKQVTVRRPVTFKYYREGEDDPGEKNLHEAIAELTLYSTKGRAFYG